MDSSLLYAEGYARHANGITHSSAWCLDGDTVVDPGVSEPGTAYFGVALRPGYVRRVHDSQRAGDGSDMFSCVFLELRGQFNLPLEPGRRYRP